MSRRDRHAAACLGMLLLLAPASAWAQAVTPKFSFAAPPEPKVEEVVEKKLSARGGLVQLSGNSKVLTGTLGAQGAYQANANRFSGEAGIAYSRSGLLVFADSNANMAIDEGEIGRQTRTSSKLFQAKGRYDRFFTLNNSAYASVQALSDVPAGKELVAGGQVGYSRQIVKDDHNRLVAELGYDLSLEQAAAPDAELVQVHSARVFVSEELKLSDSSGLFANVEALFNLNEEKAPAPGYEAPAAFEDTRVTARTGINTTLWKNLSFAFSFGLRYDQAPAPLKAPSGAPAFAATYFPLARTWDTTTEASLVLTFF